MFYVWSGVLFLAAIDKCSGIKCYNCQVAPNTRPDLNTSTPMCSKFDESGKYEIDCPYSTMCMKKSS